MKAMCEVRPLLNQAAVAMTVMWSLYIRITHNVSHMLQSVSIFEVPTII